MDDTRTPVRSCHHECIPSGKQQAQAVAVVMGTLRRWTRQNLCVLLWAQAPEKPLLEALIQRSSFMGWAQW